MSQDPDKKARIQKGIWIALAVIGAYWAFKLLIFKYLL